MTFKQKVSATVALLVVIWGGGVVANNTIVGSVTRSNEYFSTTTSAAGYANRQTSILANTSGTLGSVIVSSTTPALPVTQSCLFKDATSTTDVSSTTAASFGYQTTAGTYTFDSILVRGLIVECGVGFNGTYTITYR